MSVLIDEPVWPWRDRLWAHLVSDSSYDELHDFASRLGQRRMSFQGDHYDVDESDRIRAIELGATPVESRILVERLLATGLRRRNDKPTWQALYRSDVGDPIEIDSSLDAEGNDGPRVREVVGGLGRAGQIGRTGVFADERRFVVLVDAPPTVTLDAVVAVDADELWISGPRPDGWRSLEVFLDRRERKGS